MSSEKQIGTVGTGQRRRVRRSGFSMIELVIVVVIIGIIAAIALPRMSRGAAAAGDSALAQNLAILRNAVDLYQTEHGSTFPAAAEISDQLTTYTADDGTGKTAAKTATNIYGPYLRKIPPVTVGARKGQTGIGTADGATIGWIYDATAGTVTANVPDATLKDGAGKLYSAY
ncbi:MAG: putative fimbrial protein [Phycisphaerales bacterium]|nr:putative fimbrial protein [Phycisphaerales bacterium]